MESTAVPPKSPGIYDYRGILVTLSIILLLTWLWNLWKTGKRYANLPTYRYVLFEALYEYLKRIKNPISFTGVVFQVLSKVSKKFEKEGMVHIWCIRNVLVIFGEETMKVFATHEASADKSADYDVVKEVFGEGVGTSNGEIWKRDRKLLNPAFHIGVLKEKIHILNENANILVKKFADVADKPNAKLISLLEYCAFQNLCESILDVKEKASEAEIKELYEELDWLKNYMTSRWIFAPTIAKLHKLVTPSGWKSKKISQKLKQFIRKTVSSEIESVSRKLRDSEEQLDQERKSLIHILLWQQLKDPSVSPTLMEDQIYTIMSAGTDTIICAMMWSLYLLGQYKDVQKKAYDEVQSVSDDYITYENLCQLEYLECIVKETLRLYPALPIFARQLKEDILFGKHTVPRDTTILFFLYRLHRNPEIYPDPEKFDPDRFRSTNAEKRNWAYIPFSEGYRSCIGKKFAVMQMKVTLAYILRNYEITSFDRREDLELCWDFTLTPSKELRMRITRRQVIPETACTTK